MHLFKNQDLKIYNTLSGKKEIFKPIQDGNIGMYVCGPTVYSNVHLGNVRTFMSFDMIYRYFLHLDYKVRYVRNITDVGHIVDDVDDGEDKIAKKASLEKVEPMEIVQRYTTDFHNVLNKYNFLPPSIEPTATGHIIEQIDIVQKILKNGFAYEKNGSVYFDVIKFNTTNQYGKLSGRNIEEMQANTRGTEGQTDKKNPQDFALWKKAEPEHIMRWPSPWGIGFPGWHIECTAMSTKYLGDTFDIHGGGIDLKFPHHECEIAQNEACTSKSPVKYWMHANMLNLNGKKMSKSTGNNLLPSEIYSGGSPFLSKAFSPNVARFFMMQAHYRSILDFTNDGILAAEKGFDRLMEGIEMLKELTTSDTTSIDIKTWKLNCYAAMNDDFNTPILIANLFEGIRYVYLIKDGKETINIDDLQILSDTFNAFLFDVLGIKKEKNNSHTTEKLQNVINMLIGMRDEARANKDFALSDFIRVRLSELGIQLKDGKESTTFTF